MSAHTSTSPTTSHTARLETLEVTGIQGALIRAVCRRKFGKVPASIGVMWHHRPVFQTLMGMGRKVEQWDELPPQLASYATMAAAATIGCHACLDIGYFMAHDKGLDERKAQQVPRWRASEVFTPLERRVMEYAEAMSQLPPAVSDELSADLRRQLGPAGLVELTARVGVMNLTARMNVTLGIPAEGLATACGLPPLPARAGVGSVTREESS